MLGPIDYVVVGFKGNNFDGSIIKELREAVNRKVIRVVDLLFIVKDAQGNGVAGELQDQSPELKEVFDELGTTDTPLLTEKDVEKITEEMEPDTSAGILIVEHLWAKGLKKALADAGGFLIDDGRIHPDMAEAAWRELSAEAA
jgi:hypothetical protein